MAQLVFHASLEEKTVEEGLHGAVDGCVIDWAAEDDAVGFDSLLGHFLEPFVAEYAFSVRAAAAGLAAGDVALTDADDLGLKALSLKLIAGDFERMVSIAVSFGTSVKCDYFHVKLTSRQKYF